MERPVVVIGYVVTSCILILGCSGGADCEETRSCWGGSSARDAGGGAAGSGGSGVATAGAAGLGGEGSGSGGSGAASAGAGGQGGGVSGAGGSAAAAGAGGSSARANGSTCGRADQCQSGNCVDWRCCDSACDGVCERCDVAGLDGQCSFVPQGEDPDQDCLGSGQAGDTCAGTCDGQGSCEMPNSTTECGTPTCSLGAQTEWVCAGSGTCEPLEQDCGAFACGATACNTSCSSEVDCARDAYCDTSNLCTPKLSNGSQCTAAKQCASGLCEQGYCCATACGAPESCATGTCLCNGSACTGSAACVTWYYDFDQDSYGAAGTNDRLGCENEQPPPLDGKPFVRNADDCYDHNAQAYPGQTEFKKTERGDGSFDYNCDGAEEKAVRNIGTATCRDCGTSVAGRCQSCGTALYPGVYLKDTYGYVCTGALGCSDVTADRGFRGVVACGQLSTLHICDTECDTYETTVDFTAQRCR